MYTPIINLKTMAFTSVLKSFPKMFNQHVFRMPKIMQQNKSSFGNLKSVIGDLRATFGRRHILTVAGPQSKILPIDVHPRVLGNKLLCNKLAGRMVTRGLAGGRLDEQIAPKPDSRSKSLTRRGLRNVDEVPAAHPLEEPRVVKSGNDFERANRLMNLLLHANKSLYANPSRKYRLSVTESCDPVTYADLTKRVVVVSVGMVRALDDDELMVAMGHGLGRFAIHDAAKTTSCSVESVPVRDTRYPELALRTLAALHLTCVVGVLDVCRYVLSFDVMAGSAYTLAWTIELASSGARASWKEVYEADCVGLHLAVSAGAPVTAGRAMLQKLAQVDRKRYGRPGWIPSKTHPVVWYRIQMMRRSEGLITK